MAVFLSWIAYSVKVGVAHLQGQTDSHPCLFMWCMCITHVHLSLNAMLRLRIPC